MERFTEGPYADPLRYASSRMNRDEDGYPTETHVRDEADFECDSCDAPCGNRIYNEDFKAFVCSVCNADMVNAVACEEPGEPESVGMIVARVAVTGGLDGFLPHGSYVA